MRPFASKCRLFQQLHSIASSARTMFSATKPHTGRVLIFCSCLALAAFSIVEAAPSNRDFREYLNIPVEYGEVIYRINAQSPKQLYIVGISHRDPGSGANNSTTVQTQMEIFRIGEWLKNNVHLNLLLPEGYFKGRETSPATLPSASQARNSFPLRDLDNALLQEKLAADTPFTNAELLLMKHHSLQACQVEDRNIYEAVRSSLDRLKTAKAQPAEADGYLAELRYLQEIRTAHLLQNIPAVIEDEFRKGTIGNRTALFTIGLHHLKDIFRYIENEGIQITSPTGSDIQPDSEATRLNLLKTGYGITIILPRTLADNRKLLQLTDIERIFLADGRYPPRPAQQH